MVRIPGAAAAKSVLGGSLRKLLLRLAIPFVLFWVFYGSCTARVHPNQLGVEQKKFGFKTGIVERTYGPGLYFTGPGTTMHVFSREVHVLEASNEHDDSVKKAASVETRRKVEKYYEHRDELLGGSTHRVIPALNIQTSDGYAVVADVVLLYSIVDPIRIAKDFGWGSLFVDSFVINTFRNGVLANLGKMNAETFYDEKARIAAVEEAEAFLRQKFAERGLKVERLLLSAYRYADNYERSLHDKKVAVQVAEKNKKESLVNEERAKLQQIESNGNAQITIAEAENNKRIAKIKSEADLYAAETRAKADKEFNVALAEAKRLKANALNAAGGRYVVALETSKMFDSIEGAVMTPEQYIAFIRNAWALIGVQGGGKVR